MPPLDKLQTVTLRLTDMHLFQGTQIPTGEEIAVAENYPSIQGRRLNIDVLQDLLVYLRRSVECCLIEAHSRTCMKLGLEGIQFKVFGNF